MDDALGVGAHESARDLREDLRGLGQRQAFATLEAVEQVFALEQLHHDERLLTFDAVIEDVHDVRAAQLGGGGCFACETLARVFLLRQLGVDQLDGDL